MARTVDGHKEALGCLFRRYARLVRAAKIRFASELPTCSMSSDFFTRGFLDKFLFADDASGMPDGFVQARCWGVTSRRGGR
jgi:hypothetical protein